MSSFLIGKENLPNVHIRSISIYPYGRGVSIVPMVHLYDVPSGGWYSEESLKKNMKVMVVMSSNVDFNNAVTRGRGSLTPEHIKKISGYNTRQVRHKTFSLSALNKAAFDNELDNGHIVFPYKCSFRTRDTQNISIFAVSYLDVKQFSSENNLELSTSNVNSFHGAIVGEQVFVDGEIPMDTTVFRTENGSMYAGPVHQHSSGRYMEGSTHSASPHDKLSRQSVKNTKIKDFRLRFKTKRRNRMRNKRQPIFSDLYSSISNSGTLNGVFDMNMEQMYLQTSSYAKLLKSLDSGLYNQALRNLRIKELTVFAQHAVEKVASSNSGTKKVILKPYGRRIKIITTNDSNDGFGLRTANRYLAQGSSVKLGPEVYNKDQPTEFAELNAIGESLASARELEVNYGPKHTVSTVYRKMRTVSFRQEMRGFPRCKLVYSVDISYKDPSEKIILNLLRAARDGLSMIRNYEQRVERKTNYNYYAEETKSNLYDSDMQAQMYMFPIIQFMEMYNLMFNIDDLNQEHLVSNLVVMLHPKTVNIKSLDWFVRRYSYMYNRLTRYFRSLNVSISPTVKLGYVQGDTNRGKVNLTNVFDGAIDFSEYRVSTSIVPLSLGGLRDNGAFPVVTYSDFRAMVRAERLKYFNQNAAFTSKTVPFLNSKGLTGLNNLEYSSYTFFSPSSISKGDNNTVDISKLETIDLKKFNSLYNEDSNNTRYRRGYSPRSRRQHNIRRGRKRSFYVKRDTREREDLEEYRPSNEELGVDSSFTKGDDAKVTMETFNSSRQSKDKFQSYSVGKQSDFKVAIKDYDLQSENNILVNLAGNSRNDYHTQTKMRSIPNSIKAIMGSQYGFTKNNIYYAQGDAINNTNIKDIIKTCFLSVVKIQYMAEYHDDNLSNIKWKDMSSYAFNRLIARGKKTVLCKVVPYDDSQLKLESDFFEKFGIENKYFYLSPRVDADTLSPRVSMSPIDFSNETSNDDDIGETFSIAADFVRKATSFTEEGVGCRTLIIEQPSSKNGPLGGIDYRMVNDLVGTPPMASPGPSSMDTSAPAATRTTTTTTTTTPSSTPTVSAPMGSSGGGYSGGGGY